MTWDGDEVVVPEGITVAAAGFLLGRPVLQRSRSLREPRGYFCGIGRCFSCAMTIDGVGRHLACQCPVRDGMRVEVLDGDPPLPTVVADAPSADDGADLREGTCDVLMVGGGEAGRAALRAAAEAGARVVGVTADLTGRRPAGPGGDGFRRGMVWGVFDHGREWAVWVGGRTAVLRPLAVVVSTGASEVGMPVRRGTRPGVMTATALGRLINQGVSPGRRIFLYGREPFLGRAAEACRRWGLSLAGCADVSALRVTEVRGGDRVAGVVVAGHSDATAGDAPGEDGEREVAADSLVWCTPPEPHLELVQTAGADLFWDEVLGAHVPAFDRTLETSVPGLFVAGGVAGAVTAEQARLHGWIAGRAAAARAGVMPRSGDELASADWDAVLREARTFGLEPVEPRAWAARAGERVTVADQWRRDQA
jgi:sarcosine oxidase subunit alpha